MAKKIFTEEDSARIQISYLYQQKQNIMKSNQLRGELKDVETLFKDAYEDFDSNFMNPKFDYNIVNEIYQIPKYKEAYNKYYNEELNRIMIREMSNVGKGTCGGRKFGGFILLLLGICSLPFFMLIFPIVLIITGVRIIREANHDSKNNIRQGLRRFGISEPVSYKTGEIRKQFASHMNNIISLEDKSLYFELFSNEIDSLAKFIYANYSYEELVNIPCVKEKKKEIKDLISTLKTASKDLLEISKTLSKKYDISVKKLDKNLVYKAEGNYYFLGNIVILYEDNDLHTLEDLLYVYENDFSTVHSATCYRNDADVEKLKESFAEDTLNDLTDKLLDEGYIIEKEDEADVYIANPNNDISKSDQNLLDIFLELLDATTSIKNFENIINEA
mgnify:CR=1 FL=1